MAHSGLGGGSDNRRSAAVSFQAYLDNIQAKTGKSADDFKQLAVVSQQLDDHELCDAWARLAAKHLP